MSPDIVADGFAFIEGPRWHDGALWFSDMHDHRIFRMVPGSAPEPVYTVPERPSGLGWLPDGRLLAVSMMDRRLLRLEADGTVVQHADLSGLAPRRINDMVVDAHGRAYVGNFGFDFEEGEAPCPTVLIRVDPDGSVHKAADGLVFPNGTAITPDGGTLIVAETFAGRLSAFDIAGDGGLSNQRIWAALPEGAVPDGICLDAEGAVWAASPTTGTCLRLHEGGRVSETVTTGRRAIACMLGGADRKTLYIATSGATGYDECRAERAARLETVTVAVKGAGWP